MMKKPEKIKLHTLLESILEGSRPTLEVFVESFGGLFDLLNRLKNTPQDPIWHGEGNVYIHTQMVLEQVYLLLETQACHLTPSERLTLILAALFHDIAKPICTRVDLRDGQERIISPGHADKGRSYIAYKLLDLGLEPFLAREVMALVGHHHDPKYLVTKDKPASAYRELARLANLELLYFLEQADVRGRVCPDLEEQLENLEMFKLYAEEARAWKVTDPYQDWRAFLKKELVDLGNETRDLVIANAIRDSEAGLIFTPHEAIARSYDYRKGFSHLLVMCGPSGSGKSTWIQKYAPEYHLISLDDIREELSGKRDDQSMNGQVIQAAREKLKSHLRKHENIVWDATSLFRTHRSIVLQLGFDYKAFVTLVVFHCPESLIEYRNRQRQYAVPLHILAKQLENLDFPYITESHQTIYVDNI
jgi:predicted kinase